MDSHNPPEAIFMVYGLTIAEYTLLTCCLDGKKTDGEIRASMGMDADEFDNLVARLREKDLIGRRKGILIASIEGRSAYYEVPPMAA
jgi:hypothetical protein